MKTDIKLVQNPIITHALIEVGRDVSKRLAELNIASQVATVETVKALKELRADLNKELAEFEAQRKAVKEGILNPYNEFEAVYKSEVSEKYKEAIEILKDKIATVEDQIKEHKKENIIAYLGELCFSEGIDFITFDSLGLEINLSTTEKAYREKCNEFVERVKSDLSLIETQEHRAEIMAEYKASLNASLAIKSVLDRKQREKEEADRIRAEELRRRRAVMLSLGMELSHMTSAYVYDEQIFIRTSDFESLEKAEFQARVIELQKAIEAKKQLQKPQVVSPTPKAEAPQGVAPIAAPVVEKPAETFKARFEVTGTMAQLRALGQYMKTNGLSYTNLQ
jgi:hypothetical protein